MLGNSSVQHDTHSATRHLRRNQHNHAGLNHHHLLCRNCTDCCKCPHKSRRYLLDNHEHKIRDLHQCTHKRTCPHMEQSKCSHKSQMNHLLDNHEHKIQDLRQCTHMCMCLALERGALVVVELVVVVEFVVVELVVLVVVEPVRCTSH